MPDHFEWIVIAAAHSYFMPILHVHIHPVHLPIVITSTIREIADPVYKKKCPANMCCLITYRRQGDCPSS